MAYVLVIDDDEFVCDLIRSTLEHAYAFRIAEAHTGWEGLALQKNEPAQLVITDMGLPDCDGLDVIRTLRREYPQTALIGISGGGTVVEDEAFPFARAMGVVHLLNKPFRLQELLDCVSQLMPDQVRL